MSDTDRFGRPLVVPPGGGVSPDAVRVPTPEEYTRMAWDARRRAWARIRSQVSPDAVRVPTPEEYPRMITAAREANTTTTVTAAAQRLLADLEPEPVELIAARRDALPYFWQREAP